jgi:predicted transglutaminase-like cysteine proteinase
MTSTADAAASTAAPSIKAPRRFRKWPVLLVGAAVALAAAIALTVWALTASTPTHTRPATGTIAPARPVNGYTSFCQNNSDLCTLPSAPVSPNQAYLQFCQNNSDLCAVTQRK